MSTVLVATAGSEFDEQAIAQALRLLGSDHRYLFLCVYPDAVSAVRAAPVASDTGPLLVDQGSWDKMESGARQEAEEAVRRASAVVGDAAETRVEPGDPAETICAVAAAEGADLIVIGSHQAGVVSRILGRSVSDDVAQHAPCPVLIVPPPNS